jgi:hypothetical protein
MRRFASLMVPAVALALMADRALPAEPQMPESFQGTWCVPSDSTGRLAELLSDVVSCLKLDTVPEIEIEITATNVNSPAISMSCMVRQINEFDVCPWGMIFKNRERARALRSFQINPWGPGYHIVFQCTNASKRSQTIRIDWVMEKGYIRAVPRNYRCPWDRRGVR